MGIDAGQDLEHRTERVLRNVEEEARQIAGACAVQGETQRRRHLSGNAGERTGQSHDPARRNSAREQAMIHVFGFSGDGTSDGFRGAKGDAPDQQEGSPGTDDEGHRADQAEDRLPHLRHVCHTRRKPVAHDRRRDQLWLVEDAGHDLGELGGVRP